MGCVSVSAILPYALLALAAPRLAPNFDLGGPLLTYGPRAVRIATLGAWAGNAAVRLALAVFVRRAVSVLFARTLLFSWCHRFSPAPL